MPRLRDALGRKRARPIEGRTFDPDLAAVLRLDDLVGESDLRRCSPAEARVRVAASILAANDASPNDVSARDVVLAERPARVYTPEGLATPSPGVFFLHGGGFVTGDLDTHDGLCRRLASHGRVRVVAFDYRLAPEHPYPAAVDDALAGFRALTREAEALGIDTSRIALVGDSAGGNLSAVVARLAKDDPIPPALHVPIYPATDARCVATSHVTFAEDFMLTAPMIDWYYEHYTAGEPARRTEPNMSPLLATDLHGVSAAIVVVAGFDPLYDEGVAYVDRLCEAGVSARLVSFDALPHGFTLMTALSRAALTATEEIARIVGDALRDVT
jgi:acetyl esterase